MTFTAMIAATGENPKFIVANAHAWFAFFVVASLSHWLPVALVILACLMLAAVKEFWFDLRYEATPKQTIMDSLGDLAGYVAGIVIAGLCVHGGIV